MQKRIKKNIREKKRYSMKVTETDVDQKLINTNSIKQAKTTFFLLLLYRQTYETKKKGKNVLLRTCRKYETKMTKNYLKLKDKLHVIKCINALSKYTHKKPLSKNYHLLTFNLKNKDVLFLQQNM